MSYIQRTRASREDYGEIWAYIALRDSAAADRLLKSLDETLRVIASNPQMGRKVEELAKNLRSFPFGNYLLFFRPIDDGIQLIRVLHGARDINPKYFEAQ